MGLRRRPRPLVVYGVVACLALASIAAPNARAQDPLRPFLPWRTIATANYRLHFPAELEPWGRFLAERVESVDSTITRLVGSAPPRPVDIVLDDPWGIPNGYALPLLDRPATVWWATPPDPRNDIGTFNSWGEMLAVHELAHVTHLTRQSRRPGQRLFWAFMPARVGPVARRTPRWVREGYATVIEGQITGSGRPNGAWRPAVLRQWAIEGRLPSYAALNGTAEYNGGEFAYLGGSAFLEWLQKREGDSSLVNVWRRLSARRNRRFDEAFAGVYGEPPAILYGRQTAELSGDAMRAKADLEHAGLVDGELIQRLNWETGDPALSPNGTQVAITLRESNRPPRIVIWTSGVEAPDTTRARAAAALLRRDPQDVAPRDFYPQPKRVARKLEAANGRSFQQPRWFADNRRLVVTRWAPNGDGSSSPDLYIWDSASGGLVRVTKQERVMNGDPSPDSREIVAMRCHVGHCDIVRVYLAHGGVSSLLEGNSQKSYYRPRYSPDGQRFVASVNENGRWRLVVAQRDGKDAAVVDPDDGANRYDAEWTRGGDSLVFVSERGGIPNLEFMSLLTGGVRSVTRVTGAAVAPGVNRADGSIWFLSLHSRGYDVRKLAADGPVADSVVAITSERYGFAGPKRAPAMELRVRRVASSDRYGFGPTHLRWLPGVEMSGDGVGGFLTLFRGDIVGRWNTTLTAAYGDVGGWQGAALRTAIRRGRPFLELGAAAFRHTPSRGVSAAPLSDSLDAEGVQTVLALAREIRRDGWRMGLRVGGSGGIIEPVLGPAHLRTLAFEEMDLQVRQETGSRGGLFRARLHAAQGRMRAPFYRVVGSIDVGTTGRDIFPILVSATMGRIRGSRHPFEEFSLGGSSTTILDSSAMTQRWPMPMLPSSQNRNRALLAWRVASPGRLTVYAEGASVGPDMNSFDEWHRVVGIERRLSFPPIPVAATPSTQTRVGVGYSFDKPFYRRVQAYVVMRLEP